MQIPSLRARSSAVVLVVAFSMLAARQAAAGVLTSPSQFTGPTTKIDFETFPDGTVVPYVSANIDNQWSALGVTISDDTSSDGANAYSGTYSIPPHSGIKAIGDSTNAPGGFVLFTFTTPVSEAGIWVQNGDLGSQVEFYDSAGGLITTLSPPPGDSFAGFSAPGGIKRIRVIDSDYYMVDDLEFGDCAAQDHGQGCPGSGGITPELAIQGCATPGATITLDVTKTLGGAPAYIAVGVGPASIPVGGTCTLNVFPVAILLGPIPMGGVGPGAGSLSLGGLIPPSAAPGAVFGLQVLVVDAGGVPGFAATNGVIVTVF